MGDPMHDDDPCPGAVWSALFEEPEPDDDRDPSFDREKSRTGTVD